MGFQDPIVGGIALRIPAIRSPNFVAGSQGWTINIDGSAEFNNLTVRGSFVGTDYVINASGAFFYSGTPAAGNLIVSIAPNPGADAFGNAYPAGINTQSGSVDGDQFLNISQGNVFLGALAAGSQDLVDAAQIFPSPTLAQVALRSGKTGALPDPALLRLSAGADSATTGSTGPYAVLTDLDGDSDADWHLSGSVLKTNQAGSLYTWQLPTAAANWAMGDSGGHFAPFQYSLDALDNIVGLGAIHATAALAAGTYQFTSANNVTPYIPKKNWRVVCVQTDSGDNYKATAYFQLNTTGQWKVMTSTAIANGDNFYLGATFPLGNRG